MIRKIAIISALIVLMAVGLAGMYEYRKYQRSQHERAERLQKQAQEIKVTIKEGVTLEEVAVLFDEIGLFSKNDFLEAAKNFDTTQFSLINKPKTASLEGYLFPDTYRFSKQSTAEEVIGRMLENFEFRLRSLQVTSAGLKIIPNFEKLTLAGNNAPGLTLHQILTLASIIEQEGGGKGAASGPLTLAEERALVASVFYNRLNIGQALESDATINYITGKNSPAPSYQDLDTSSAYNTYRNPGLPPGPIGNPSLGSISAAINPVKSDYFYFLHYQPSGKVDFSKTFSEHVKKKEDL